MRVRERERGGREGERSVEGVKKRGEGKKRKTVLLGEGEK